MSRKRGYMPIIVKSINDLVTGMLLFALLGCGSLLFVGWWIGKPTVEVGGCCGTAITTLGERIAGSYVFGTLCLFFFLVCLSYAQLRRRVLRSISEEELCERFGMDQEALRRLTQEQQIAPRFLVADQPHYEWSDFGEAATLLRACSSPSRAEELLRAGIAPSTTPSEQLLRAQQEALEPAEKSFR